MLGRSSAISRQLGDLGEAGSTGAGEVSSKFAWSPGLSPTDITGEERCGASASRGFARGGGAGDDATGQGVAHTRRGDVFRRGQPVSLDEDLVELRAAANRFLRPEDDPGHGWRLDHPIGKMAIFQAHLHAQRR